MALEKGGLKAEQAQRVALGSLGGALTALEKGGVEAAITMQVVWAQRADKLRIILDAGRDLPPMVQSVGIATGDLMKKHPEKLRKILAARREAVQFMNAKPDEAAKMLEKHFSKMPPEVLHKVTISLAKSGYWSEGKLEREPMENMARGLRLVGDLKDDLDWSKIIDASFLPKDLQ
jgi:NitT/TauT family transport system substrate-binding protein